MKIAFITQPWDGIGPGSSLGILTCNIIKRLIKNNKVIVFAKNGKCNLEDNGNVEYFHFFYKTDAVIEKIFIFFSNLIKYKENKNPVFNSFFYYFFYSLSISLKLKKINADIVHIHNFSQFVPVIRFFNKNIKILLTSHGADAFTFDNIIGNFIKKFTLQHIDGLTVVSNAIKDKVKEIGYNKEIGVYPMGVDTDLFNPGKKDLTIRENLNIPGDFLLFVGRLSEKKGLKYLLEAMLDVVKEFPLISLVIIGDGPLKSDLTEVTKKSGITANVIFLGPLPHEKLPSFFATADIFIGPSITARSGDSEGFGLVFAEAMSSGTIVLASDVSAIKDIVKDNETGFIVKQKNSRELSEKILYLLIFLALFSAQFSSYQHYVENSHYLEFRL